MFLDTSGLFCYQHDPEPGHADAITLFEAAGEKVTHNYVLAEFVALATTRGISRTETLRFLVNLAQHPEVEIVWVDEDLHNEAMLFLQSRLDKRYSLCDAVSFMLMKKMAISQALTTDHHFEQEGFGRMLLP